MADDFDEPHGPAETAELLGSAGGGLSSFSRSLRTVVEGGATGKERSAAPALGCDDLEAALIHRLAEARPYALPSFDPETADSAGAEPESGSEADVELQIELGRALLPPEEGTTLREGAVVPLDKLDGDTVDILVDGRLIARGEVLILNDKFCVRVAEIIGSSFATERRSELVRA